MGVNTRSAFPAEHAHDGLAGIGNVVLIALFKGDVDVGQTHGQTDDQGSTGSYSGFTLGDLELFALESDVIRAHRCDLLARLETTHSNIFL